MDTKLKIGKRRLANLAVCIRCGEVCGWFNHQGYQYKQRCACTPVGVDEAERIPPGYDYTALVELCNCCGLVPIRTGSRWSLFFCETCHKNVVDLNNLLGEWLIPIGRHTLMNQIFLSGKEVLSPNGAKRALTLSMGLFARIDRLRIWSSWIVLHRLNGLFPDARGDVSLLEYLKETGRSYGTGEKLSAFRGLCHHFCANRPDN